jgi:hypothetical protein
MASRNPALPLDSHVQSHEEVFKNELCEFPRSPHSESDRRWLDSDPKATELTVRFWASQLNVIRIADYPSPEARLTLPAWRPVSPSVPQVAPPKPCF